MIPPGYPRLERPKNRRSSTVTLRLSRSSSRCRGPTRGRHSNSKGEPPTSGSSKTVNGFASPYIHHLPNRGARLEKRLAIIESTPALDLNGKPTLERVGHGGSRHRPLHKSF